MPYQTLSTYHRSLSKRNIKENFGSFSIRAAVRCGNCFDKKEFISGVS